jgi:PIN domain nuclease of toxin-antitoxin system
VKYLLDSHVIDWAAHRDPRLSARASEIVSTAAPGELAISDVTLTELARHLAAQVIITPFPATEWLARATAQMVVLPVTHEIAIRAAFLDWTVDGKPHRDPCDRHIVATAAEHKLPLVTIDEKMHALVGIRGLKVIW